jgi:2-amino-4-hydroxy-6-hydroxymethyldihydropteridine diphosphokinase
MTAATEVACILSIGSNLGDRERYLRDAVNAMQRVPSLQVVAASGIVESAAHTLDGVTDVKPAYLNAVVAVSTTLAPESLLDALAGIESAAGRERIERWGDRTLDIDIVTYGDRSIETERLSIPHPRAHERSFVLQPWASLDPDARLAGRAITELLAELDDPVVPYDAAPLVAAQR